MRFLLCNRDCQISGGTTYLLMLAEGLLAEGHEVTLAAGAGMVAERFDALGVRRLFTVGGVISSWLVQREATRNPPDVVVYGGRGSTRDLAASVARTSGAVGVCVLQDHVKSEAEARSLRDADAVVVLEEPIHQQALSAGVPADRLHNWPRPVLGGDPLPQHDSDSLHLLWMGRMSGNKAWSAFTLLEAIPAIAEHAPNTRLTIVGSGSRAGKIRRAAKEVNQQLGGPIVEFQKATNDPLAAMRDASIVVGGGYTCLEALYNGRPAIASGFEWLGPVTKDIVPVAYDQHFGDRSQGRTDEVGMTTAVCDMVDAMLAGDNNPYAPSRDWFPVDHACRTHAAQMVKMAASVSQGPSLAVA